MKTKHFISGSILYFIVAIADIYFINNNPALRFFTKPLLLIILSILFFQEVKKQYDLFAIFIQAALFFSWVGDAALLLPGNQQFFFISGLSAFLIAHIFFILAFIRIFRKGYENISTISIAMVFAVFISYSLFIFNMLKPHLGPMHIQVFIYMIVITVMATLAGINTIKYKRTSFALILAGAVQFIISDSLLAFDKFVIPSSVTSMCIMVTYVLAQFFITWGSILYIRHEN